MRKKLAAATLALCALAGASAIATHLLLKPDQVKAWIVASVYRSTGRTLSINGPLKISLSLRPAIVADDVRLANIAGGTRPDMARVEKIEARFFLPALLWHRIEITDLWLKGPNILFEQTNGKPNWVFNPPPQDDPQGNPNEASVSQPPEADTGSKSPYGFVIRSVRIKDGLINWQLPGHRGNLGVRSLRWNLARNLDALDVQATLIHADHPLTLTMHAVPQGNDLAPWDVHAVFSAAGGVFENTGTAALNGQYDLRLKAQIPQLDALSAWVPGITLPPATDVKLSATISNHKGLADPPTIQQASVHIGGMALERWLPGWRLGRIDAILSRIGQPAAIDGEALWDDRHLPFKGTMLIAAQPTQSSPVTVDLKGADLKGVAPAIPFHDAALQGRLAYDAGKNALLLQNTRFTAKEAALETDAVIRFGTTPKIEGSVQATHFDLDSLLPAADKKSAYAWLDAPLPWSDLQMADIELSGHIASLIAMQHNWRDVNVSATINRGALHPLTVNSRDSGSNLSASVTAEATSHKAGLILNAPVVPLSLLVDLAGGHGHADGTMRIDANLSARGTSLRTMKTTLDGSFDAALQGGTLSNADLPKAVDLASQALSIPRAKEPALQIACMALSGSFVQGEGRLRDIALDTTRLKLVGDGIVNFNDDTMALKLHPLAMVAGAPVSVPVLVKGPFTGLSARLDANGLDQAGLMVDALFGGDTPHICRRAGFVPPGATVPAAVGQIPAVQPSK